MSEVVLFAKDLKIVDSSGNAVPIGIRPVVRWREKVSFEVRLPNNASFPSDNYHYAFDYDRDFLHTAPCNAGECTLADGKLTFDVVFNSVRQAKETNGRLKPIPFYIQISTLGDTFAEYILDDAIWVDGCVWDGLGAPAEPASDYYTKEEINGIVSEMTIAKNDAVNAKVDAVSAANAAVSAKNDAVSAKNDAVSAKNDTVSARSDAVQAKMDAVTAAGIASNAATDAGNAKTAAESAKANAVSAKNDAVSAKNDSVSAKNDAVQAKNDAVSAAASVGNSVSLAESYAKGGTGTREGENTDNSKYYKEQSALASETATAAKNTAVSAASTATAKADEAAASAASAEAVAHRPPPKCNDMGNVIGTTTIKLTWSDPEDLVEDGWVCAEWQRTVAVMKVGGYPASVDDGVIVAATSRSPETDTYPLPQGVSFGYKNAYIMDSVTVNVEDGDTACIKLFSCARTGTWNNLAANEYPSYTSYSWGQLAEYADAGTFTTHIPVGSVLDMENTDFPNAKWLVADTDCFELQNQAIPHHVALLSYRALFTEKCDEPENQWALTADTAAVTGITYGLNINGTMAALTEGTDWTAGDTSVTRDGVTYPIADWYEKNPNGNYNYGTNFTPQTNMQQWFTSDGAANQWFTPQNLWDKVNSTLANRPGFQHGLPATFKSCLLTCKRTVYVYTSYRKRGIGESLQYNANVFALTNKEVFNTNTGNVTEGRRQLSFLEIDADHRKCYFDDGTTAVQWWLASAYTGNAISVYCVSAAGTSTNTNAHIANGYRPACAFGKQASL